MTNQTITLLALLVENHARVAVHHDEKLAQKLAADATKATGSPYSCRPTSDDRFLVGRDHA